MEKWMVLAKRADFYAIAQKFNIDPVIARIIRNRDVIGDEAIEAYLHGGTELLHDPYLLKGMEKAVRILRAKVDGKLPIRIIGDYDIDGVMSSYILKRGLGEMGARVDIKIPNRLTDGYGMNVSMIEEAAEDGIDTILTCDNGIAALDAVRRAKELGMTVVVTDHHEVLELPEADAVVDPKQEGDAYPNKNLCGAGVAWKLILAMGGDPNHDLMQYVAFATVGDVVNLTGENRVIVREGLKQLQYTDNAGLIALAKVQEVDLSALQTYHIGYVLGPCLNASGRLDTAMRATELLECSNEIMAKQCAEELKSLNDSRKAMTEIGLEEAIAVIEENGYEKDPVFVIYLPKIHESVAGIIAGRVRERYGHPTFILTNGEGCVKGSGRSIEEYSMFDELVKVKDLLLKFGGHPMAAGLSIRAEDVDELRRRLNEQSMLSEQDLVNKIRIDVPMPISYVTEDLINQIQALEPYGKGNEKPIFAQRYVYFDHPRLFGAKHNLLKCRVRSMKISKETNLPEIELESRAFDAVCFKNAEALYQRILQNPAVSIIYEPQINDYMGRRSVQIVITHFQ